MVLKLISFGSVHSSLTDTSAKRLNELSKRAIQVQSDFVSFTAPVFMKVIASDKEREVRLQIVLLFISS